MRKTLGGRVPNPSNGPSGRALRADPDHLSSYLSPLGFHSRSLLRESALCNETSRRTNPGPFLAERWSPPFRPRPRPAAKLAWLSGRLTIEDGGRVLDRKWSA